MTSISIDKPISRRPFYMLCGKWCVLCPWHLYIYSLISDERAGLKKVLLFFFLNQWLRIFLKLFSQIFSKKFLTLEENMCIMCLLPPNRRNETKTSEKQNWASESVKENQGQRKKVQKSFKKCLTKFQNSCIMGSHKQGMPHPTTKSDENANHQ